MAANVVDRRCAAGFDTRKDANGDGEGVIDAVTLGAWFDCIMCGAMRGLRGSGHEAAAAVELALALLKQGPTTWGNKAEKDQAARFSEGGFVTPPHKE